ncbi:MAG: porin [Rhizobiaceae bacterium]|nr:porin [Rhizobiaceae bacterium]
MNWSLKSGWLGVALLAAAMAPGVVRAEGLKPIEYTLPDGTIVRFSGQINMGVLHYDDGRDGFTNFVDNDNSSSRARFQIFNTTGDWKFESTLEAEYQPLASNTVSQFNDEPDWDFPSTNLRKAEIAFANERFGKLWLGQGSMASDGSAEVDNSGTNIIAYSSVSDTAGGYFFRLNGNGLSDVTVGSSFSNFDGLGRKLRVRYDTPTFHGFGLRASYGEDALGGKSDPLYDIAAVYSGGSDVFDVDGAIAYAHNDGSDVDTLSGSISALHKPTGISLTLAAAREFTDGVEGSYGYAKLGYQHDFFDIGATAFSVDYYFGKDIAADGSDSDSIGLAAVQNIDDYNLQLWALWRNYSYDDDGGEYDDGQAFFGGALFKF